MLIASVSACNIFLKPFEIFNKLLYIVWIMKPRADSWTIVIVGFWNRMIFTPQWVLSQLFHKQEVEKLVPMLPVAPLIYRDDEIVLHITEQQIIVQTRKFDKLCLGRAEKMACEILNALPVTPVSAIGVNFGFVDTKPNDGILKLFNFSDDVPIGLMTWGIGTRKIERKLIKDEIILNFTITQDSPLDFKFDANFHYPVKTATEAVKIISDQTVNMHDSLIKLIKDVYALNEEETNE